MKWITLFLVSVGFGSLFLAQGLAMAVLGLSSLLVGFMVGRFDIIREATE